MSDKEPGFDWREDGVYVRGPGNSDLSFDTLKAYLDYHADASRYALNADLFRDGAGIKPTPLTWRQRWQRRFARVRAYFSTLWLALKGHDPYEGDW